MHRIEATNGSNVHEMAPTALLAARRALAGLQAQTVALPAVDEAIEAVAGSLGHPTCTGMSLLAHVTVFGPYRHLTISTY